MIEVGRLKVKDVFIYKNYMYRVIDKNNIFIVAVRKEFDGITRYFLHAIEVEKEIKTSFKNNNPNHDITDRFRSNG
mgnify:CR=1 FL=1|tara:strand:- start:631 stop:858 length:228 start_codon:yes stop_codon:yes gene_type:complete